MKKQSIRNSAGRLPDLDIEEVLARASTVNAQIPEETRILIARHHNPEALSFDELTDVDGLSTGRTEEESLMNTKKGKHPFAHLKNKISGHAPVRRPFYGSRELRALLNGIDLYDPRNRLSPEKVRELKIPDILHYISRELTHPLYVDYDLTELSSNLKFIIHALHIAVRDGLEETAGRACSALVCAVKNLLIEIEGIGAEFANALWETRTEYSRNLKLLVQACINKDRIATELKDQQERRRMASDDLEQFKKAYLARKDTGSLDLLLAELSVHAATPALLSTDAAQLKDELAKMRLIKASLVELDMSIDTLQHHLDCATREIDQLSVAITMPSYVSPFGPNGSDPVNEERRRLIAHHSRVEYLSFNDLTNIEDL